MSILKKPQWLLSLGTDFKWLELRLRLGIQCMITDCTFLSQSFLGHCSLKNLQVRMAEGNNIELLSKE